MKYISALLFTLFFVLKFTSAQTAPPTITDTNYKSDANIIFTKVEVEAEFVGGFEGWKNYLIKNLNINKVSDLVTIPRGKKELKQTIIVKFVVDKEGNISDVSVDNPEAEPNCIEEAMRVIRTSPKWVPAKQNGRIVKAYRRQPITFVFHR
jgi:periplasmic protein TonB